MLLLVSGGFYLEDPLYSKIFIEPLLPCSVIYFGNLCVCMRACLLGHVYKHMTEIEKLLLYCIKDVNIFNVTLILKFIV